MDFDGYREDLRRLDYYNVTEDEIDTLITALRELNSIAEQFFADFSDKKNDLRSSIKR